MRKVLLYFISRKRKSQRGKMNCMRSCLLSGLRAHGSWRVHICFQSAEDRTPGGTCGPRDGWIPDNVATAQGLSGVTASFHVTLGHADFFPSS